MNAVICFAYGKTELYPRFPLWIGEVLTYVQKPRLISVALKVKRSFLYMISQLSDPPEIQAGYGDFYD